MLRVKSTVLFVILLLTAFTSVKGQYPGTNLRGQVLTYNNYRQVVPVVYARIDLLFFDARYPPGQQWRIIATTSTDAYGFYFFRNITPNYYTIQVNQAKSLNIQVIFIDYRYYVFQDISPIYFP